MDKKKQKTLEEFDRWQKDFPDILRKFKPKESRIIETTYCHINSAGEVVEGKRTDDSFNLFRYAVKLACFCASRYQKDNDKNNVRYQKDNNKNNTYYEQDKDSIKEAEGQRQAVKKILKYLNHPVPVLFSLERVLDEELQQRGITTNDPHSEAAEEQFHILKNTLKAYQTALSGIKREWLYSVGCLEYPTPQKPTQTPSTAAMLVIQLAVYITGVRRYREPWSMLRLGFSVDIPAKIGKLNRYDCSALTELVNETLNTELKDGVIPDILRKRIIPGMKLCPWPEMKFLPSK